MAHRTVRDGYSRLAERLNRFPQGAPSTEGLFQILQVLFAPEEAALVALLPIKPFTAADAARVWQQPSAQAQRTLEELASRGMMLDLEIDGEQQYVLPPPMAGFFEFSMMRMGAHYDQKLLAELFYQYLSVEDDFMRELVTGGETQLGRAFVNERALPPDNAVHVLDYERASEVIATAEHIAIGACYCRHKMMHLGKACDAPLDICMTFNSVARSLTKRGIARTVDAHEGHALLDQALDRNLVQFGENVRERVAFICHCCGCCCEAMTAARRFAYENPIATTNFLPEVHEPRCAGCGRCVEACPMQAMTMVSAEDHKMPRRKLARLNAEICLGCGVCVRVCEKKALTLRSRAARVITPVNTAHRTVLMAIERGKLQNLIFDNQALRSHRAMAAVLGVILKLPPVKQAMASRQLKSRYLERLVSGAATSLARLPL